MGLRLAILEPSWAILSRLGATLERCWRNLGPHRMISGKHPPSGTVSGPIWNGFGTVSGLFWRPFWSKKRPKMDRKPSVNQSIRHRPINTRQIHASMIWGPAVSAQRSNNPPAPNRGGQVLNSDFDLPLSEGFTPPPPPRSACGDRRPTA